MCELLGISSKEILSATPLLDAFYQHSIAHPHGWGLAVFYGSGVSVEKEPVRALDSRYLQSRLSRDVKCSALLAHIRYATIGRIEYANCHPFVWDDKSGRTWTLVHNGTLFEGGPTKDFLECQEGSTDSERLLLYIVSRMNAEYRGQEPPEEHRRFLIMDEIIHRLAPGNKLNLLVWDGENLYVHTNCRGTMYRWQDENKILFATKPLLFDGWIPVKRNQLLVCRDGKQIWSGRAHSWDFREEEVDMTSLFSAYSEL